MKDVKIDDDLHKRLKMAAITAGESLKDYAPVAIEAGLKALADGCKNCVAKEADGE